MQRLQFTCFGLIKLAVSRIRTQ